MKVSIFVPTYNGGRLWLDCIEGIQKQDADIDKILIIDSGSKDETCPATRKAGFELYEINNEEFNHGGTRQLASNKLADSDILIYITQDAILKEKDSINAILAAFNDSKVGAAYGRQLPRKNSNPIEAHARLFNYPSKSLVKSIHTRDTLGIKTVQLSNSFAAYRLSALNEIGGFPDNIIACEDSYVAAKLLLSNWGIAYCAEAEVFHSHNYSIKEEFKRYFDVGTFYGQEQWITEKFGHAKYEGIKYIKSEMSYLFYHSPWSIPEMLIRTVSKLIGYNLGKKTGVDTLYKKENECE